MKKNYVVIENLKSGPAQSWNEKTEAGEVFATEAAANKRALSLAASMPGEPVGVYALIAEVVAPVGKPIMRTPS